MQQKFGECKGCGFNKPINAKGNCVDCQYLLTHGKTRFEVAYEKQKNKPNKVYQLKRTPLKRPKKGIKKKFAKNTGEYEIFLEIWKEREHRCVNCKMNLDRFVDEETQNPSAFLFSHIKSKGARVDLRLKKENIMLNCPECHYAHEHIGDETYNKRKNLHKDDENN